jgi:hypothetical protein
MVGFMKKNKKRFKAATLRDDIHQFISGFINGNPNNEVMTIIVEPKQTSLHLFQDWLKGAVWNSESRNRKIRSPRWGRID